LRLQERPGSENGIQREAREVIERQVTNLTKLVSDLLEVSRVVSGRIRLDRQTIDLNQVIEHAIQTVTPLIEQHKHALVLNLSSEPCWCDADPTRIEEVFINLLSNAAKYTPDGGRIDVSCEQPHGENHAQVRVRDNGVGIDRELLPRIFDLFTQADRSLARSAGGLGIGLSLAHKLVDLHGGSIKVDSPPQSGGVGSEFIVRLALTSAPRRPEAPVSTAEKSAKPEGVRVLVVDDNIDSATMLATLLRHAGYSVQAAYTGPDGLKVALQWRPDTVLLDIGLPGLDGYEVARRLRGDAVLGESGQKMRLIALTGYGRDTDIALAREAGFDEHMVKPIDLDKLNELMANSAPS
jgi:CheY-like chemotaxis protein/two-component sensor histidine kinase